MSRWSDIQTELQERDRSQCWTLQGNWTAYPMISINGVLCRLSRSVLEAELGRPIESGLSALHTCDNDRCYNPDHLYEGTQQQNIDDARSRGRLAMGPKLPQTKLSPMEVQAIQKDFRASHLVAADYDVSSSTIRMIRTKKRRTN